MFDVSQIPGDQVVHSDNIKSFLDETVAKMGAEETRGTDVRVLDLREITPVFDYFVIATGSSRRQMHAMADEIEAVLKKEHHDKKRGAEGYEEGRWIVLDYGDVMVHLFDAEARDYWDIEHLWSDAKPVPSAGAGAR